MSDSKSVKNIKHPFYSKVSTLLDEENYFDFNLKRSQGRKVSLTQSVKKPTTDELFIVSKPLVTSVEKSEKSYSGNWVSNSGSLKVNYDGSKTSLLHSIGQGLKDLRRTD